MGQLATELRKQISQSTALQAAVGVCEPFFVDLTQNASRLSEHLEMFTQDNKPMLGNPAHPRLFYDECNQLIVPFCFADHEAVAVIRLGIASKSRYASIAFFDPTGHDLDKEHLAVFIAFFTQNRYSVDYQCISESLVLKKDISQTTLICYKALDRANQNANISSHLVESLVAKEDEIPVTKPLDTSKKPLDATNAATQTENPVVPINPMQPVNVAQPVKRKDLSWIVGGLVTLISLVAMYFKYEYLKESVLLLATLLPADPILAFLACGGVFFSAWLVIAGLGYLIAQNEAHTLDKKPFISTENVAESILQPKMLLNAFSYQRGSDMTTPNEITNSPVPIKRRSLS